MVNAVINNGRYDRMFLCWLIWMYLAHNSTFVPLSSSLQLVFDDSQNMGFTITSNDSNLLMVFVEDLNFESIF